MSFTVRLRVNGQPYEREIEDNRLLVDFLRYDLGLTGTKEGCGVGVCGACTVMLNGKIVSSCLTLTAAADGADITTVEGIAQGEDLAPIQKSFVQFGGYQCGICTPGQIVSAQALLNEIPNPTEEQIKEWMMGNLCRCTGYYKILESIQRVGEVAEARS